MKIKNKEGYIKIINGVSDSSTRLLLQKTITEIYDNNQIALFENVDSNIEIRLVIIIIEKITSSININLSTQKIIDAINNIKVQDFYIEDPLPLEDFIINNTSRLLTKNLTENHNNQKNIKELEKNIKITFNDFIKKVYNQQGSIEDFVKNNDLNKRFKNDKINYYQVLKVYSTNFYQISKTLSLKTKEPMVNKIQDAMKDIQNKTKTELIIDSINESIIEDFYPMYDGGDVMLFLKKSFSRLLTNSLEKNFENKESIKEKILKIINQEVSKNKNKEIAIDNKSLNEYLETININYEKIIPIVIEKIKIMNKENSKLPLKYHNKINESISLIFPEPSKIDSTLTVGWFIFNPFSSFSLKDKLSEYEIQLILDFLYLDYDQFTSNLSEILAKELAPYQSYAQTGMTTMERIKILTYDINSFYNDFEIELRNMEIKTYNIFSEYCKYMEYYKDDATEEQKQSLKEIFIKTARKVRNNKGEFFRHINDENLHNMIYYRLSTICDLNIYIDFISIFDDDGTILVKRDPILNDDFGIYQNKHSKLPKKAQHMSNQEKILLEEILKRW